jgi:glycosyltransferase involved in cell wall biosynthesis
MSGNRDMLSPKVSCLMPVRLIEPSASEIEWLHEAISSVLSTDLAVEVILIDDGSTIPVEYLLPSSFIKKWKSNSLRNFRFESSVGLIRALNFAIDKAKGEIIARLDADDFWHAGSLRRRYECLTNAGDAGMVYGGLVVQEINGAIKPEIRNFSRTAIIRHGARGLCVIPHGAVLIRRSALLAVGGYEFTTDSQHVEDFATWSNFVRFFDIVPSGKVEYTYRRHPGSVSTRFGEVQKKRTALIADRFQQLGDGHSLDAYYRLSGHFGEVCRLKIGLELASAWRKGGQVLHFGERDVVEDIFYDRIIDFEGDFARVLPALI